MKLEFSAGGIIFKTSGKDYLFALILDSYDQWTFPKGHIEKGEKPEIAAAREVAEEMGLKNLTVTKDLGKTDYWFRLKKELFHKYVYYFLMEAPSESELRPQIEEIKDAQWFSPAKAKEILGYKKDSLQILEKAFEELKIVLK